MSGTPPWHAWERARKLIADCQRTYANGSLPSPAGRRQQIERRFREFVVYVDQFIA
jgi:hypothetical protein